MKHEFEIPAYSIEHIRLRYRGLCRRAKKLGKVEPTMTVSTPFPKEFKRENHFGELVSYYVDYILIGIEGIEIKVDGWTFAATIEHTPAGNIIRKTPGCEALEIPVKFRTTGTYCDHCKTRRRRKDTFLVTTGTGGWMQIGRNCLRDFLGIDPGTIVSDLDFFSYVRAIGDEDPFESGPRGIITCDKKSFMKFVFHFVRTCGWTPRSKAEHEGDATADQAWNLCLPCFGSKEAYKKEREIRNIKPEDGEKAEKALVWAEKEICSKPVDKRSDYEHNLAVALLDTIGVREKTAGIVASLVVGYQRSLDRESENKNRVNEWTGEKGTRAELTLEVKSIKELDGNFGPVHLHIFEDAEGRSFKWFGSTYLDDAEPGDTVKAKWGIKGHEEYKGRKQTMLSRPTKIERSRK